MVKFLNAISKRNFSYKGNYQIQSRTANVFSEISGTWLVRKDFLSSNVVNQYLSIHPFWNGKLNVELRVADVTFRSGLFFTDEDILVKRQFFKADIDGQGMEYDFVDVNKSINLWSKREMFLRVIFNIDFDNLLAKIQPLDKTIVNEYFCHEAGHCLGYDINGKYLDGYFKINEKTIWPLVFIEEFRADLHSFGFAAKHLKEKEAVAIFLYNILLRFGVEIQSHKFQTDGYGALPYLLFHFLWSNNVIGEGNEIGTLKFLNTDSSFLIEIMVEADRQATDLLTSFELECDVIDSKIAAVKYYNLKVNDQHIIERFNAIFR